VAGVVFIAGDIAGHLEHEVLRAGEVCLAHTPAALREVFLAKNCRQRVARAQNKI